MLSGTLLAYYYMSPNPIKDEKIQHPKDPIPMKTSPTLLVIPNVMGTCDPTKLDIIKAASLK